MVKKILIRLPRKLKFLPQETYIKVYHEHGSEKKSGASNPIGFFDKIAWSKTIFRPQIVNRPVRTYVINHNIGSKVRTQFLHKNLVVHKKNPKVDYSKLLYSHAIEKVHHYYHNPFTIE